MNRSDEPAYPIYEVRATGAPGMTIREAFAMAAMQGFVALDAKLDGLSVAVNGIDIDPFEVIANASVRCADALLAELAKERT
jgi:hypothetical protein